MQEETASMQKAAEETKEFHLKLFGKLELSCGDTVLTEEDIHSAVVSSCWHTFWSIMKSRTASSPYPGNSGATTRAPIRLVR